MVPEIRREPEALARSSCAGPDRQIPALLAAPAAAAPVYAVRLVVLPAAVPLLKDLMPLVGPAP